MQCLKCFVVLFCLVFLQVNIHANTLSAAQEDFDFNFDDDNQTIYTQHWEEIATNSSPSPRALFCSVINEHVFTIFGGVHEKDVNEIKNDVHSFSLASQTWSSLTLTNSLFRYGHSCFLNAEGENSKDGEGMMFFGGFIQPHSPENQTSSLMSNDLYILSKNVSNNTYSWERLTPGSKTPPALGYHTAVFQADSLWVFGGLMQNEGPMLQTSNTMWTAKFDMVTLQVAWSSVSIPEGCQQPIPRMRHTMIPYQSDGLLLFGGELFETGKLFNDVWLFNTTTISWVEVSPELANYSLTAREGHGCVSSDYYTSGMLCFGGCVGDEVSACSPSADVFSLTLERTNVSPTPFSPTPPGSAPHASPLAINYKYISADLTPSIGTSPPNRDNFAFAATNNFLYVFGGRSFVSLLADSARTEPHGRSAPVEDDALTSFNDLWRFSVRGEEGERERGEKVRK
eukprot:GCRY01002041.1.p1 GENE.GCRY01002041.1~~GCRY01002041.1.p1  ORF type:complete len:455 (+),score=91.94 GCRY01002041.1:279-1643(+)